MANKIRVFIGVSLINKKEGRYSLLVCNNKEYLTLPTGHCKSSNNISYKQITLQAILSFLTDIENMKLKEKLSIVFYANNDEIAFEWNQEHLKENALLKNNAINKKDKENWQKIIKISEHQNISIEIKGTDSLLQAVNKRRRMV